MVVTSAVLASDAGFAEWRRVARSFLHQGVAPEQVDWNAGGEQGALDLGASTPSNVTAPSHTHTASRAFLRLAKAACLHCEPQRFALLYRLLWRLQREPRLMEVAMDPDVARLRLLAKAVRREVHKMHAFVRFRALTIDGRERHIAWFEPEHHIVRAAAPFFVRRFASLQWSILTPELSAHWDGAALSFSAGARRSDAPSDDAAEALWRTYYASIFNPARVNPAAMRAHMPRKYWRNLPESALIPQLIAGATERTAAMIQKVPHPNRVAKRPAAARSSKGTITREALAEIREQAEHCRDCPLWKNATQTVFGEGMEKARILFVGEQPGDQEDLAGRPFVGPAGRLLDRALADAGVERSAAYVTNAVKHFKFEPRGKRRIHRKPNEMEIAACHQWLERELRAVNPDVVVALGATAARAVFGRATAINQSRGKVIPADQAQTFTSADVLVTVHPSYLLRVPDEDREAAYQQFVADLRLLRPYA